jgi:hypothetical protein
MRFNMSNKLGSRAAKSSTPVKGFGVLSLRAALLRGLAWGAAKTWLFRSCMPTQRRATDSPERDLR